MPGLHRPSCSVSPTVQIPPAPLPSKCPGQGPYPSWTWPPLPTGHLGGLFRNSSINRKEVSEPHLPSTLGPRKGHLKQRDLMTKLGPKSWEASSLAVNSDERADPICTQRPQLLVTSSETQFTEQLTSRHLVSASQQAFMDGNLSSRFCLSTLGVLWMIQVEWTLGRPTWHPSQQALTWWRGPAALSKTARSPSLTLAEVAHVALGEVPYGASKGGFCTPKREPQETGSFFLRTPSELSTLSLSVWERGEERDPGQHWAPFHSHTSPGHSLLHATV